MSQTRCPGFGRGGSAAGGPLAAFAGVRWADYLGVAPFLIFAVLFLIVPTVGLVVGAFQATDGSFTLQNIADLGTPQIVSSFWISIRVSAASAVFGAAIGLVIALAVIRGRLPSRSARRC